MGNVKMYMSVSRIIMLVFVSICFFIGLKNMPKEKNDKNARKLSSFITSAIVLVFVPEIALTEWLIGKIIIALDKVDDCISDFSRFLDYRVCNLIKKKWGIADAKHR